MAVDSFWLLPAIPLTDRLLFHTASCAHLENPSRRVGLSEGLIGDLKTSNRQNAYAHVHSVLLCLLIIGPPDKKEPKTKQNNQWHEVESHGPSPVHVSDL